MYTVMWIYSYCSEYTIRYNDSHVNWDLLLRKWIQTCYQLPYMGKIWWGKNWWILANRKLFVKIFIINIHRYTKMHLAYALTVVDSPNFSSPIAFTCMVHQNFPPPNISHVQYLLLNVNKVLSASFTSCFINISAAYLTLYFT